MPLQTTWKGSATGKAGTVHIEDRNGFYIVVKRVFGIRERVTQKPFRSRALARIAAVADADDLFESSI